MTWWTPDRRQAPDQVGALRDLGRCEISMHWQKDTGWRDFYVSSSGNDRPDGRSTATAWRSIGKVTFSAFQGGDRILFEGGKTFDGTIYFGADDKGTAAKPIVVTSYGTGRATIQAGALVGLLAYNTAGIEVRQLNFAGPAPGIPSRRGSSSIRIFPETQNFPIFALTTWKAAASVRRVSASTAGRDERL